MTTAYNHLSGSKSYSNIRDLTSVQPTYHQNQFPLFNGFPMGRMMSPEQAIAENHYDVPRPLVKKQQHTRSSSCINNTAWKIQLHDSFENHHTNGKTSSPVDIARHPVSAPSSPVLSGNRAESYGLMSPRDQSIYHSLGSNSSKLGKPSFAQLGLMKDVRKTGIMSKTGPSPSWITKWNRRVFALKDNFLFYFDPVDKPLASAAVLGGVYIKDALIERVSLPFSKRVLKIIPTVARRKGWNKDGESGIFYIKFRTDEGRDEWYEILMSVALGHQDQQDTRR